MHLQGKNRKYDDKIARQEKDKKERYFKVAKRKQIKKLINK